MVGGGWLGESGWWADVGGRSNIDFKATRSSVANPAPPPLFGVAGSKCRRLLVITPLHTSNWNEGCSRSRRRRSTRRRSWSKQEECQAASQSLCHARVRPKSIRHWYPLSYEHWPKLYYWHPPSAHPANILCPSEKETILDSGRFMQSGELESDSPSQLAGPTINGYVIEKWTRNFYAFS